MGRKNLYLSIYELIKRGKNPSKICKELSISKQKLYYYTHKLKEKGLIEKLGYGVWRSKKTTKDTILLVKEVRGHAFIWKVKLPKIKNWNKRKKIIKNYKVVGKFNIPRIYIKERKVWLGDKNIIIYDHNSFYGKSAIESRKYAFINLIEILEEIERKLKINLKPYQIKPTRQHYSLVKNNLAIQCNRQGKKIRILSEDGSPWFIIDDSYNLDELETLHRETALIDSIGVQKYFNSHRRTDFKVTPEFILKSINGVTENQVMFAKNIEYHFEVLESIKKAIQELREEITKTFKQ